MSLPAYTMGQVGLLDFSPIQNALGQAIQNRQFQQRNALDQQRMGMDQERLGFERSKFEDGQRRQQELERILSPTNPSFRDVPPQLVELSRATRDPGPIVQHYVNSQKGTDDIKEFEYARRQGFQGQFSDWMAIKRKGAEEEYNKNLVFGTDERGNTVPMQAGTKGNLVASKLPPGVNLQRDFIKIDAGDSYILMDPTTRQPVGRVPKNIAGAKVEEAVGEDRGKIITTAPKLIATVESLEQQHRLVRDEIRKALELTEKTAAAGIPSIVTSKIPGTAGYQLSQLIKTIKANVGFDKLNQMRAESPTGGALGQVAVQELEYLQAVLGSLEQAQDPAVIQENLFRLNEYLSDYGERRRRMLEADLKRAGVSPDILNRQQGLNRLDYGMADRKGAQPAADQREFVGMQVDSRPGIPVAPERTAAPPSPAPAPLPKEQRVYPRPPQAAVDELMRDKSEAAIREFIDTFGEEAAKAALKGRR